jgi:hypothetical protein
MALAGSNATAPIVHGADGYIAPQDEAYMAAGLGGSLAAMRHPLPQLVGDSRINGNRNLTSRIDEVTRAPPVGTFGYPNGTQGRVLLDPVALTDSKVLTNQDSWDSKLWGKTVRQGAPARTTRGLSHLPCVTAADSRYPGVTPWVVASKHPNGAVAVAALGRTLEVHGGWIMPRANITVFADAPTPLLAPPSPDAAAVVGVFGAVGAVTIVWESSVRGGGASLTVWAQDLAGGSAVDVTDSVAWCQAGAALFVPGDVINSIGTSARHPGDVSDPGVVLAVTHPPIGRPRSARSSAVACPVIPSPPAPPVPPPPSPPVPPPPPPGPPITAMDLNGTWVQQSKSTPSIEMTVTNGGGDVTIVGHDAGNWNTGTGVILDGTTIDAHCIGPHGFATHQIGVVAWLQRNGDTALQISWKDGPLQSGERLPDGRRLRQPLAWAPWIKKLPTN